MVRLNKAKSIRFDGERRTKKYCYIRFEKKAEVFSRRELETPFGEQCYNLAFE